MAESAVGGGGKSRKLTVEVCNARNLMPKDGQGTASAYVIVDFDGQRRRTKTQFRDLNPQWDERLEFLVHDPDSMASEAVEITVYNDKKTGKRTNFLGRVKIAGATFAEAGSEVLVYYPLEKRSVFSQIKGEIGVKVWYVDEKPPDAPAQKEEQKAGSDAKAAEKKPGEEGEGKKKEGEKAKGDDKEEPKKAEAQKEEEKSKEKTEEKGDDKKAAEKPKKEESSDAPKPAEGSSPPPPDAVLVAAISSPAKHLSRAGDLDVRARCGGDRSGAGNHDLVERVPYLFLRALRARRGDSSRALYAKVSVGTHTARTRASPAGEWDQVFAFHAASLNSTALDVSVWTEKTEGEATDACHGAVSFDLQEVPRRSPPDSPLAPQWLALEGDNVKPGEDVMLAIWLGSQLDEAFQEAWHSDSGGSDPLTRSKAYLSPKLWYLRLTVIQTQDLRFASTSPARDLAVRAQLGAQVFKTCRPAPPPACPGGGSVWNEDLVFVAAEPFEPFLVITVEETGGKSVGSTKVHVSSIHRRVDDSSEPPSRWFNLSGDTDRPYAGRIHVRVCLEGGYHVLEEAAHVASDVRAASKQLSKPPVGLLEVGVRGATNLLSLKTEGKDGPTAAGSTDAYVVLKYGPKWARTRTVVDQFNPGWNEQYAWEVFDPCTVLTVGVFDNGRFKGKERKDTRIGKVRIRLSTLDVNRIHLSSYPLTLVQSTGSKKMGEIELAIRFTCPSWITLLQSYCSPVLPRMHYVRPLGPAQQDLLRHTAMRIVSARLARSEPPLGPEVVQYMLDTDASSWSMRRSKANWLRVVGCLSWVAVVAKWVRSVRTWQNPTTTVLVHLLLVSVVICPQLILPTLFLYLFLMVMWRYKVRPRGATGSMDPRLSCVDMVGPDELDEEFDTYPSTRSAELVRARYDRIRALAGRAQTLLGDLAAQGERVEALLSWRDPRATGIFAVFCLAAAALLYAVPAKVVALAGGMYYLRHPRFRGDMPPPPMSFFRRLPSLADRIL